MTDAPPRREVVNEALEFDGGDLLVRKAPGLGVELNEETGARFPYQPTDLPLFTGRMSRDGVADGEPVVVSRRCAE
jgi:galactonate dehydratase